MVTRIVSMLILLLTIQRVTSFSPLAASTTTSVTRTKRYQQGDCRSARTRTSSSHTQVLLSSRFEGNQRIPTAEENALMDEMIEKLADAKPYELPTAVKRAFRVIRSPQFFLRIAGRADGAQTEQERKKYEALASNLVSTLEAVVETTAEQLDERAGSLEMVVKAAAEPDSGEFLVPLTPARLAAMRGELRNLPETCLDEGFLTTLDSWIVKSHQDGMDLMVGILQKVLQMYAGLQIQRALESRRQQQQQQLPSSSRKFEELLQADADLWDNLLGTKPYFDDLASIKRDVQRTMETVVFSLETGSMAQQVQAEYLKELLKRVEAAERKFL